MRVRIDEGAFPPTRAHETDAGLDLYSNEDVWIPAGGFGTIHTGTHIELPKNTAGLLVAKSGLNVKDHITSTGLIDEGYTGEIIVKLYNHGVKDYIVEAGDKVSQLIVIPVLYEPVVLVDDFGTKTERGENGFGSTGR